MKRYVSLVAILTVICVVAGMLLALVNNLTAEPIAEAARRAKMTALKNVLPPCDNDPAADARTVTVNDRTWTFYVARRNGAYAGAAFETGTPEGYGGDILVMVGVNADGAVSGIEILSQKETPGLGAKIAEPAFKQAFAGRDIKETKWAVRKDGGDIDQITAATISSRAVVQAVKQGLAVYTAHQADIRTTGEE